MSFSKKLDDYILTKKNKISQLTNNKINSFYQNFNFVYDDQYFSKNVAIYDDQSKKILVGKYEILGYNNRYDNKWTWAFDNKYLEKYFSDFSKNIYDKIKNNKINKDLDLFLNLCLYYSDEIWILKKNINFDSNLEEFIIITDIIQIT